MFFLLSLFLERVLGGGGGGYYSPPTCSAGTYLSGSSCYSCRAGSYQPYSGQSSCYSCPAGSYQPYSGATSCYSCSAGSYMPSSGSSSSCFACPAGRYQPSGGQSYCSNCPAGNFQPLTGRASCSQCLPGTYSTSGATSCTLCPAGTYSGAYGASNAGFCTPCPAGTYSSFPGQTSASTCQPCPSFTFSPSSGAAICTACPLGAMSLPGATQCRAAFVNTFAGSTQGFADGNIYSSLYSSPSGLWIDSNNNIFIADKENHRIRKITGTNVITVAGNGSVGMTNGLLKVSRLNSPSDVAVDSTGVVYIADTGNNMIRVVYTNGSISTLAGSFNAPSSLTIDGSGNIIVSDTGNNLIKQVTSQGQVTTIAGSGSASFLNAAGTLAAFNSPVGIRRVSNTLYIADRVNNRIRYISSGYVGTSYGSGVAGSANGMTTSAQFSFPNSIAVDDLGNMFISDTSNHRIRVVSATGFVATLAGGLAGWNEGLASVSKFNAPTGIAVDSNNVIYVADSGNHRIRRLYIQCPVGQYYYRYTCWTCPAGTYQPYAAQITSQSCLFCPKGTYSATIGATSLDSCKKCPAGTYSASSGTQSASSCTACPAGTYSSLVGATSSSSCTKCPIGTFSAMIGAASINACVRCPSMSFARAAGSNNATACASCPLGSVSAPGGLSCLAMRVRTIAGNFMGYRDGSGNLARFNYPNNLVVDSQGNIYVTDRHMIRKISKTGVVSTLAGSTSSGFADGSGRNARFNSPTGIAIDGSNNLLVADSNNHRIRRISQSGVVTTFAGSSMGYSEGSYSTARFYFPSGIAIDSRNNIYVTDRFNQRIRKLVNGVVSTLAGSGGIGSFDGVGVGATFNYPRAIAVDSSGNVYISDNSFKIRRITPTGVVSTVAGNGGSGVRDGPASSATFTVAESLAVDADGVIYVADSVYHRVRVISGGLVSTFLGTRTGFLDGWGSAARFYGVSGVALDRTGYLYIVDRRTNRIRRTTVDCPAGQYYFGKSCLSCPAGTYLNNGACQNCPQNTFSQQPGATSISTCRRCPSGATSEPGSSSCTFITPDPFPPPKPKPTPPSLVPPSGTISGSSVPTSSGATSTSTTSPTPTVASQPVGLTTDSTGNVVYSDSNQCLIKKVVDYDIINVAGSTRGFADGASNIAKFDNPTDVIKDSSNNIYVADTNNHRIRIINLSGNVATFSGDGTPGLVNSNALTSRFNFPTGLAIDSLGNIYVADSNNHCIRRISAGVVTTFAGTGVAGYADDYNAAALFNLPNQIAIAPDDTLYVTDAGNHVIRMITTTGLVSTVAGTGVAGYVNDEALSSQFDFPMGIIISPFDSNTLFVADKNNSVIRKISSGFVTNYMSMGLAQPQDIVMLQDGTLIISDTGNARLRKMSVNCPRGSYYQNNVCVSCPAGTYLITGSTSCTSCPAGTYSSLIGADSQIACIRCPAGTYSSTLAANSSDTCKQCPAMTFSPTVGLTSSSKCSLCPLGTVSSPGFTACVNNSVSTSAGSVAGHLDAMTISSQFRGPRGLAIGRDGTIYIADSTNHRIRRLLKTGAVNTFAGNGNAGYLDSPTGTSAQFNFPNSIVIDTADNLIVVDRLNHRIRKISPSGVVTTLAGSGGAGLIDATGISASFNSPFAIAMDSNGDFFVTDEGNNCVRKVTAAGVVSTVAGASDGTADYVDATGSEARFNLPRGILIDSFDTLYIADAGNARIRMVTPEAAVSTLAGTISGISDGPVQTAQFTNPSHIVMDQFGVIYVASGNYIRYITQNGLVGTLNMNYNPGTADGLLSNAQFNDIGGMAIDTQGRIFVSDTLNTRIRLIGLNCPPGSYYENYLCVSCPAGTYSLTFGGVSVSSCTACPAGTFSTITGSNSLTNCVRCPSGTTSFVLGSSSSSNCVPCPPMTYTNIDDGSSTSTCLSCPTGTISGAGSSVCQPVIVRSYVGSFVAGHRDGNATSAIFNRPWDLAVDTNQTLYVTDYTNNRIRKVTNDGSVTTFAGSGSLGLIDGQGTSTQFKYPHGVAVDAFGTVYVADQQNSCIRKISPSGLVSILSGPTFTDEDGVPSSYNSPNSLTVDNAGVIYISDTSKHRIIRLWQDGTVNIVAGSGSSGYMDGLGNAAFFSFPQGIAVNSSGFIFVADRDNHRIRTISPDGNVTTYAGSGTPGSLDGARLTAQFNQPYSIVIDSFDVLYVTDLSTRIRIIPTQGNVYTLAGNNTAGYTNGLASTSQFQVGQGGLAVDQAGVVYVSDLNNHTIRRIYRDCGPGQYLDKKGCSQCPKGTYLPLTGGSSVGDCLKCPAGTYSTATGLTDASQCTQCPRGTYSTTSGSQSIDSCSLCPPMTYSSVLGSTSVTNCLNCPFGTISSPGQPACSNVTVSTFPIKSDVKFNETYFSTTFSENEGFFVADKNNHFIRAISTNGYVTNKAGSGIAGFKSGPATGPGQGLAMLNSPMGFTLSRDGREKYIVDTGNHVIRKISCNKVDWFSGTFQGILDGQSFFARFNSPTSAVFDKDGILYVTDTGNHRIRKVERDGDVSTFAGSTQGFKDDVGQNAKFNGPFGITIDPFFKFLYVSDENNHRIRRITISTTQVTTIAGNGTAGWLDGATSLLNRPRGLYYQSNDVLYIADYGNHKIRIYANDRLSTLVGGAAGFNDGTADVALLNNPISIIADGKDNILVSDLSNKIRLIKKACPAGTYLDGLDCTQCPAGTYSPIDGAISPAACIKCLEGSYSNSTGAISESTCQSCPPGSFARNRGQMSCDLCRPGTYSSTNGTIQCPSCAIGMSSDPGATSCDGVTYEDYCDSMLDMDILSGFASFRNRCIR